MTRFSVVAVIGFLLASVMLSTLSGQEQSLSKFENLKGKVIQDYQELYASGLPYASYSIEGNTPRAGSIVVFKTAQITLPSIKHLPAEFLTFYLDTENRFLGYKLGHRRLLVPRSEK